MGSTAFSCHCPGTDPLSAKVRLGTDPVFDWQCHYGICSALESVTRVLGGRTCLTCLILNNVLGMSPGDAPQGRGQETSGIPFRILQGGSSGADTGGGPWTNSCSGVWVAGQYQRDLLDIPRWVGGGVKAVPGTTLNTHVFSGAVCTLWCKVT